MTHKFSHLYSLGVVTAFFAILTVLIAAAVQAQVPGLDQRSGKAPTVPVAQMLEGRMLPGVGALERASVSRSRTKRNAAGPVGPNPPLFLAAVNYSTGELGNPSWVAIADVNGDGKPDIVVANVCASSCDFGGAVGVLLGNGDGTFQSVATYLTGVDEYSVAVADVNRDGHPDIVVADANGVEILLGNGDGTFQPAYNSGGSGQWVAVADVNGDGKPDLVVGGGNDIEVLLGNGDGTFHPPVAYGAGGSGVAAVAIADVNRDGHPDIEVADGNGIGILPGNGDGTFQPAVTYNAIGAPALAVADVNGDGKLDLVVGGNDIQVLLGNGDGTFQPAMNSGTDAYGPTSIAVADVNRDGKPDLVVADWFGVGCSGFNDCSSVAVLLGNGDGTFQTPVFYDMSGADSWSVALADVNGDGRPDVVVTMGGEGVGPFGAVGVMLHVGDIPTTTALVSSANPSVFGQAVTLTATVTSASGTPTGTVVFFDGSAALGNATLVNGSAPFPISSLATGSHSITAVYQGSLKFNSSASSQLSQVVSMATTTTSLASSTNPVLINSRVKYTATVTGQYGGTATGTLTFHDGGVTVAAGTLVKNQAIYSTSYKTTAAHAITATYSGDANNVGESVRNFRGAS